ncbi:MAG: hypothetical protein EAZ55_07880 [Cytophagales bacterium]|nr:MAG: hypothetical protein EAZ55_07880 [Cytophagales bacterium]
MSELYRIKIKSVAENKVRAEIKVVHPDAGTKFASRDFALQILIYTALSKEDWKNAIYHHPMKSEYDKLKELLYGQRVASSEAEYEKLANDRAFYEAKNKELKEKYGFGISSYGFASENWHIQLQPNTQALLDKAYQIVAQKPKKSTVKDDKGKIIKKTYSLDFEVVDAQYLAHLVVGMEYDTAAYELESYEVYYHNYSPPTIKNLNK